MPRTGGVYSPPAGTKGVSGSTIQSVPYNNFVDDLASDANAARPITAGGTGATTPSGARSNLGTDNADNLLSGTVADARLPGTMSGKTFTSSIVMNGYGGIEVGVVGAVNTPFIDFHSSANSTDYDSRIIATGGNSSLGAGTLNVQAATFQWNGSTIWTAANDGAGSGMDSDLLDGQQGAYYLNAANLTGTISDARLPSSMVGKNFTSPITLQSSGLSLVSYTNNAGTTRAVSFYDHSTGTYNVNFNNTSGAYLRTFSLREDGLIQWGGNTVWHSGNDGAGSGLDADLLDGQDGSYFTNIPARLGFTPIQQGGGANQGTNKLYIGYGTDATMRLQIDVTDFGNTWPMNITGNAGSANNASNLGGTPASSFAQYSQSSNQNETVFPLGQVVLAGDSVRNRRDLVTLYLRASGTGTSSYAANSGTTALAGTWRQCGTTSDGGWCLYQRVA